MSPDTGQPLEFQEFVGTVRDGIAALKAGDAMPAIVRTAYPTADGPGPGLAELEAVTAQVASLQRAFSSKLDLLADFVEQATAITRRATAKQVASLGETQKAIMHETAGTASEVKALRATVEASTERVDRRLDTIDARLDEAQNRSGEQVTALEARGTELVAQLDAMRTLSAELAAAHTAHVARLDAEALSIRDAMSRLDAVVGAIEATVSSGAASIAAGLDERLGQGPGLPELLAMFSEAHEQAYTHAIEAVSAQLQAQLSRQTIEIARTLQSMPGRP
ncbi:MAG: hypothetical protein ACR2LQ_07315 [Acidimicrobiales bacterium]